MYSYYYFIKNPETTIALTFLTFIISAIGGVNYIGTLSPVLAYLVWYNKLDLKFNFCHCGYKHFTDLKIFVVREVVFTEKFKGTTFKPTLSSKNRLPFYKWYNFVLF